MRNLRAGLSHLRPPFRQCRDSEAPRTQKADLAGNAPFFSDAERAALKLTEAMTRLSDLSGEPVPDALWAEVAAHFDERELSALRARDPRAECRVMHTSV
ncbi:hypothetical protein GCM10010104_67670 [Streptomyces indiaensis]|uniref:Uncharacterized protein n=1 Tax=Streptomyces indiaensis TaxID=284033 RepID=A0ABP5RFT2_9ACTN